MLLRSFATTSRQLSIAGCGIPPSSTVQTMMIFCAFASRSYSQRTSSSGNSAPTSFAIAESIPRFFDEQNAAAIIVEIVTMMMVISTHWLGRPARFLQLPLEHFLDSRVLLIGFDLLDLKGNSQALREIALGHGEVARFRVAGVEVLMEPKVRRRYERPGFPINLHRIRLEIVLAGERKALAVESENDRFVRMTVTELVTANLELRHVRLKNRIAGHLPEDACILAAALGPRHNFRSANVANEVRLVPSLAHSGAG